MDVNPYQAAEGFGYGTAVADASPRHVAKAVLWFVAIVVIASEIISGVAASRVGYGFANVPILFALASCGFTAAVYLSLAALGQIWPRDRPTALWILAVGLCLVAAVSLLFRLAEYGQAVQVYQAKMQGVMYMNCAPPPRFVIWFIDSFGNAAVFSVSYLAALLWR